MSQLTVNKQALGDAILKGTLTPSTSTAFTTSQNELWTGSVSTVASQITSLGIRVYALNYAAQQLYGLPGQPGDFVIFNQAWVTTQTDTAVALMAQLNASTYVITTKGGSDYATTIYLKDVITGANTGAGAFTITGDVPYVIIEFASLVHCSISKTRSGYQLATDPRKVILVGTVGGGNARYLETGATPTSTDGILVVDGNPFDVVGKINITNAKIIDVSSATTVNYEIYEG